MQDYQQTQNPNAIEQLICLPIEKLPCLPMDEESVKILFKLLMSSANGSIPEKEKPFLYRVIENRIKHVCDFTVNDPRLIIMLCQIFKNLGKSVMILWYLQYWCKKNNCKNLTLDIFCEKVFPNGYPSDNDLRTVYQNQKIHLPNGKIGSDNLIDYADAGKSVMFNTTVNDK